MDVIKGRMSGSGSAVRGWVDLTNFLHLLGSTVCLVSELIPESEAPTSYVSQKASEKHRGVTSNSESLVFVLKRRNFESMEHCQLGIRQKRKERRAK